MFVYANNPRQVSACLSLSVYLLSSCELDAAAAAVVAALSYRWYRRVCSKVLNNLLKVSTVLFLLEDRWQRTLLEGKGGQALLSCFTFPFQLLPFLLPLCVPKSDTVPSVRLFQPAALCLLYNRINLLNKTAEEKAR